MTTVPAPTLAASPAPMMKPLAITLSGVKFTDGTLAGEGDVVSAGVFVFRGAPGAGELWDDAHKTWRAAPSDDELGRGKPIAAMFKPNGAASWQAMLVAIGQKDAADADVYTAAVNGAPSYFVRGLVKSKRTGAEETTLGPPSAPFTFAAAGGNSRFTTEFDTPTTKPDAAHKVRLQLKNDAMQPAGYLEIRAQPSFEVEIASCDINGNPVAKVLLAANGDIRLTPGAGARVVLDGDIETGRILYAPAGGGAKQLLT